MQLRHLRYFVKIVDAGSFSRAAGLVHIAQPALSQQIAELEDELGVSLLQRHARGVRPTPAGETLYQEATAILKRIEHLPGLVRSSGGEPEGTVELGMSSTLASTLGGPFVHDCRERLPKVMMKFRSADSETLRREVAACVIHLAVVFEDELVAGYLRTPLFRQRLYYVASSQATARTSPISMKQIARLPLVLPGHQNILRGLIDRRFAEQGLTPIIASEADQLSSVVALVRQGLGATLLPVGVLQESINHGLAQPLAIEPPLFLTASVIWSGDAAPSRAADAVRAALTDFIATHIGRSELPGLEPIYRPKE
jgi:LysR family nitrogen assimilation transcriptional regulator